MNRRELEERYRDLVSTGLPAVAQGERMLGEGAATVRALDARSLAWRGKAPKA